MKEFVIDLSTVEKAKKFVNIISRIDGNMDLQHDRYVVDAKSIMGIFSFDLSKPVTLVVHSGDEAEIKKAIKEFIV